MSSQDSGDSPGSGISRRSFVQRAGVATVGLIAVRAGTQGLGIGRADAEQELPLNSLDQAGLLKPGVPEGNVLEGDILSTGQDSMVIYPATSATPVKVTVLPDAKITKEGVTDLSAYSAGDEVVVLGVQNGNQFTAVEVAAVFRVKQAKIYSRQGNSLRTSEGEVLLTGATMPRGGVALGSRMEGQALSELQPNDEIIVLGTVNQNSGVMTASAIGVVAPPSGPLVRP